MRISKTEIRDLYVYIFFDRYEICMYMCMQVYNGFMYTYIYHCWCVFLCLHCCSFFPCPYFQNFPLACLFILTLYVVLCPCSLNIPQWWWFEWLNHLVCICHRCMHAIVLDLCHKWFPFSGYSCKNLSHSLFEVLSSLKWAAAYISRGKSVPGRFTYYTIKVGHSQSHCSCPCNPNSFANCPSWSWRGNLPNIISFSFTFSLRF